MSTTTILEEASAAVGGPRQADYGPPEQNLTTIANLWGEYLGIPVTATDVCMLMVLLKVARASTHGPTRDTLVDIAGYARCAELCQPHVGPFEAP